MRRSGIRAIPEFTAIELRDLLEAFAARGDDEAALVDALGDDRVYFATRSQLDTPNINTHELARYLDMPYRRSCLLLKSLRDFIIRESR